MRIALDTETTGVDFHHGALPFFVTVCDEDGKQQWWEWNVDPLTRHVSVPIDDALEIRELVNSASEIILQNAKFDVKALFKANIIRRWPWEKTHDTLMVAHILASNKPRDLTSLATQYLGRDIEPLEKRLCKVVQRARHVARTQFEHWAIAEPGLSSMPSIRKGTSNNSDKAWRNDCWLPRALMNAKYKPDDKDWETVLHDYANADSAVTMRVWQVMEKQVKARKYWRIYEGSRQPLPGVIHRMEMNGVTYSMERLLKLTAEYQKESDRLQTICVNVAASYDYELVVSKGINKSLLTFCFDVLKLERIFNPKAKTSRPALDSKYAIPHYLDTLKAGSKERLFISSLADKRKFDKRLADLHSYRRFGIDLREVRDPFAAGYFILFPSTNPTGTDTLRMASYNPNSQNISAQEDDATGKSIRYVFGPAPGREWYSLDYENIELVIPAYLSNEEELIRIFRNPNAPPYFGSYHLFVAHILFPEKFAKCNGDGRLFKTLFKALYKSVKNGDFAVQYGAVEKGLNGTADRAFGLPGAHKTIKNRLSRQDALNIQCRNFADNHGFIETVPDREVDPERGYPLLCTRSEHGRVLPTVPLNYKIQGTAMQCTCKAEVRCQKQIDYWNREEMKQLYWITLQQHDEIVFDFPAGRTKNREKVRTLKQLMMKSGEDIGIPLRVAVKFHPDNWDEGERID
jgi:DNA polymerase I-like protein with 3'-5' exonuclease and polymerase domains